MNARGACFLSALAAGLLSSTAARALDCEAVFFFYNSTKEACEAGDPVACRLLPAHEANFLQCDAPQPPEAPQEPPVAEVEPEPPQSDPAPPPEDEIDRAKAAIQEIQTLLAQLGYDPGPADGVMGARTCRAIEQFNAATGSRFACEYSIGLRDALILELSKQGGKLSPREEAMCRQVLAYPAGSIVDRWKELAATRVDLLKDHDATLAKAQAALEGDLGSITGIRDGIRFLLQAVNSVIKFSLGKAAAISIVAKDPNTARIMLSLLAAQEAGEQFGELLRGNLDALMHGDEVSLETIARASSERLDEFMTAVDKMIEGGVEIHNMTGEQQEQARRARQALGEEIAKLRAAIQETQGRIAANNAYVELLGSVRVLQDYCTEQMQDGVVTPP